MFLNLYSGCLTNITEIYVHNRGFYQVYEHHNGQAILDCDVFLTKQKLDMSILGFFNLCFEFSPPTFCEFVKDLGSGRPFFCYFMHPVETLHHQILQSVCAISGIVPSTALYRRIVTERGLFYDNDHLQAASVETLGLWHNHGAGGVNLRNEEFANLITVAMYLPDLRNLCNRIKTILTELVSNTKHREMMSKFLRWIIHQHIVKDLAVEQDPLNEQANQRGKWKCCEKFATMSIEKIMECAGYATKAAHLLRTAARSTSFATLEKLFQHYISNRDPETWQSLFEGSKTIAYFIKYVDAEDLNLAFTRFSEQGENAKNTCFRQHLLRVRKLLKNPVVTAQDLVNLSASSSSYSEKNASKFFDALKKKAANLPEEDVDLRMIYCLTANWMQISRERVLFPLPPRNAQIITVLTVASWAKSLLAKKKKHRDTRMGKCVIAQVGTGEGKSLVIAMMAIYCVVVLKKRVHVLENNPSLLKKDVANLAPLYACKEFNIKTREMLSGDDAAAATGSEAQPLLLATDPSQLSEENTRGHFAQFGVTYTLRRNLERYYQDCVIGKE